MEKERARAEEKGYDSPICKDKPETDAHFNAMLVYIFDNLEDIWAFIGTHNEESNYLAIEIMAQKEIAPDDGRVWFGQLYGMSDNISFVLADLEYNVVKLIPFGPIEKTIPYLIRRANENSSVKGQSNRQFTLIKNEINRRKDLN